jgi:LAS superfamily LD-carboxypeptidase LdcB
MTEVLRKRLLIFLGAVLVAGGLGYGVYAFINLTKENTDLTQALKLTQSALADTQNQNIELTKNVTDAQNTVDQFGNQVGQIASTVNTLARLAQTDPELLRKYSKVFFLNENYIPKSLSNLATSSLYIKTKPLQIHTNVQPFLERLLSDLNQNGLNLLIISAYRSFGTQSNLKFSYKVTFGSGSNRFSAEQGYSEHQLGTTVDFTTPKIADTFSGFSKTLEYNWLVNNAYKYGFILSYPKGNSYYIFEPWHWRFVGVSLATMLHNENKYFYDLDQREIDPYLINIFN